MPSKARGKPEVKAKQEALVPRPAWPALQPLAPSSDLSLLTLLEDQIIIVRNFFTSSLCKRYVSFLSTLPLVTTPAKPKDGDAVRVNDRIEFNDYAFAQELWRSTALESLVSGSTQAEEAGGITAEAARRLWGGEVCGLNPRIRIYRYKEGQFFAQHCKATHLFLLFFLPFFFFSNSESPKSSSWDSPDSIRALF